MKRRLTYLALILVLSSASMMSFVQEASAINNGRDDYIEGKVLQVDTDKNLLIVWDRSVSRKTRLFVARNMLQGIAIGDEVRVGIFNTKIPHSVIKR